MRVTGGDGWLCWICFALFRVFRVGVSRSRLARLSLDFFEIVLVREAWKASSGSYEQRREVVVGHWRHVALLRILGRDRKKFFLIPSDATQRSGSARRSVPPHHFDELHWHSQNERRMYDAIIVGAGPAGLQPAMALSCVRRPHLIIAISKLHRNVAPAEMHTFLTYDGTPRLKFIRLAKQQLDSYGFAKHMDGKVVSIEKVGAGFEVKLVDGSEYGGRKLIIATGVKDVFLPIEGTVLTVHFLNCLRIFGTMEKRHCALHVLPWL